MMKTSRWLDLSLIGSKYFVPSSANVNANYNYYVTKSLPRKLLVKVTRLRMSTTVQAIHLPYKC